MPNRRQKFAALAAASIFTPWQTLCLTQVLFVQRLLAKRNIPGQFYLGVLRGCERTADPMGLSVHAWLQCDDDIANGRAGHEHFTVVSTFSWAGGDPVILFREPFNHFHQDPQTTLVSRELPWLEVGRPY
jgi:hypothetical protein